MTVRSCWILAGTETRCHIRRSRPSQTCSMDDMSDEYGCHARTGMFLASRNCVQILATYGHALSCSNIRWWLWMNGTTMGLRISSRCLCAFNIPSIKCTCVSLYITYACLYHNPTATMGQSIHNVDISKLLTHKKPYTLSAICPVQWKPWIREENTSPKCQTPSNVSICPLKSVTTTNCSQVKTPMRTTSMQMSFPVTVSDSLCRNYLVMQTDCFSSCLGGCFSQSWRWRCWMWRSWSGVVTRGLWLWGQLDVLPNSLKRLMVQKWTFNSWATALVDIPAVSMTIARSLKTCDICGILLW